MKPHSVSQDPSARNAGRRTVALIRIFCAFLLAVGFSFAGDPARADITDHTGHQFHNQLLCDPEPFARTTRLVVWRLDNKPAAVFLMLSNTKTGAALQSDRAGVPSGEDVPGHVVWNSTWTRSGDEAVWGPDEAWVTYPWPDGSTTGEQLTDVGLIGIRSRPGNTICVLWVPGQ